MKTFFIFDGSSLLTSSYYATLPHEFAYFDNEQKKANDYMIRQAAPGYFINGVDRALSLFMQMVLTYQPSRIAVCFDKSREGTFRRKLYPLYKAQRGEKPESLKKQFPITENILLYMGVPIFLSDEYEADDFAGSLAKKYAAEDMKVVLITRDRDYLQLIDENVSVWLGIPSAKAKEEWEAISGKQAVMPETYYLFNTEVFKKHYGLIPKQIIDLKALSGDTSDNIPGVAGIGEKTAIPLLQLFGDTETVFQKLESGSLKDDELKTYLGLKKGIIKRLSAPDAKDKAFLSKKLATIKTDISIPYDGSFFTADVDKMRQALMQLVEQFRLSETKEILVA